MQGVTRSRKRDTITIVWHYRHLHGWFFCTEHCQLRLTYTSILNAHFRNIGKANNTADPVLLADFNYNLGTRYQTIWDTLSTYINTNTDTDTTVNGTQYYAYPLGTQSLESLTVTIGSVQYTLTPIYDQGTWNSLNALQIQPTAIPQFFFPRQYDYGIWPIPTAAYTISTQKYYRDRNLLVADYTGTATLTNGSATLTGVGTTFTAAMVGRWVTVTDTSVAGQGYWLKLTGFTNATTMTMNRTWTFATATSKAFTIGESPELPEGAHILLPDGTATDFYAGLQNDADKAKMWDNKFWTGSMSNISRKMDDKNITGGLIGLARKYKDRVRDNIVVRQPPILSPSYKIFAETIS